MKFQAGGPNQHLGVWAVLVGGLLVPVIVVATVAFGRWPADALWLALVVFVLWALYAYLWLAVFVTEVWIDEVSIHEVAQAGGTLRWRGLVRGGEVGLGGLLEVRGARWHPYAAVIIRREGRPLVLYLRRRGFLEFARELGRRVPDLRVRESWMLRVADRSSIRSGLRER